MMIMTLKLPRLRPLLLLSAVALACWTIVVVPKTSVTTSAATFPSQMEQGKTVLEDYGWAVEPASFDGIALPEVFGAEYDDYLRLQEQYGLPLADHAGKTVLRCTYRVTNYPDQTETVYADLLFAGEELVGGDIRSSRLDGFMCGLGEAAPRPHGDSTSKRPSPQSSAECSH